MEEEKTREKYREWRIQFKKISFDESFEIFLHSFNYKFAKYEF